MCGIFAYLNHLTPKTRAEVIELLIKVRKFIQTIFTSCNIHDIENVDAGTKTIGIPWI